MNEILKIVLSLSLSGSLLFFVLLFCKPLLKNRISKCWQYYIWLVVIARLILPFSPETSFVGTLFQEIDRSVIVQSDATSPARQEIAPVTQPENGIAIDGYSTMQGGESVKSATLPRAVLTVIFQNLWLVWLVIALILLIRKITIYQGFVRYLKAGREEVSVIAILDLMAIIGEEAGVKRPVELYTNSLIGSPLLLGFFRPCIVLPTVDLPDSDFEYTILHELTHYKRWDMFYKWLVQLTICLHWFNPLAYLLEREVSRACELACDEAVIRKLDTKRQRDYGDTLLNAVVTGGDYREPIASMTLNESKELLKERLDAIMKFKNSSKAVKILTTFLSVAIIFGATYTGAYAAIPNRVTSIENATETGSVVFNLNSDGQNSIHHSSSFEANANQTLLLDIQSSVIGGTVDFFLFSPTGQGQRITIGGSDKTETVALKAGRWAYNCTGSFKSGAVTIKGQLSATESTAISGQITSPENMKIAETNSMQIKNGNWNFFSYTYVDKYMIGIGSRAQDNLQNYSQTIQIAVNDKEYTVAFYEQAKMNAKDGKFIESLRIAVADVISQGWLANQQRGSFLIVSQVIADKTADELYEYFCEQGDPIALHSLTPHVKKEIIEKYIAKAYEDNNELLMMLILTELPNDFVLNADNLARRAISDGRQTMYLHLSRFVSPAVREELDEKLFVVDDVIPPLPPVID